jgi:predicted DNA-binding transcriptional regulator AlpA
MSGEPNDGQVLVPSPAVLSPLCVDANGVALMLGVSPRTVRRMDDAGHLLAPITLRGAKRWVIEEIQAWLRAGAPRRQQWNSIRRSVA